MDALNKIKMEFKKRLEHRIDAVMLDVGVTVVDIQNTGGDIDDIKDLYEIAYDAITTRISHLKTEEP